jgi:hypothetical protein
MVRWFQGLGWSRRLELAGLALMLAVLLLAAAGAPVVLSGPTPSQWAEKGWWERAYYVSNALLPVVAIVGVWIATGQLQTSARASKAQAYIDLESRWALLLPWRKAFSAALEAAKEGHGVSTKLDALFARPAGRDDYVALMAGPYLFESVGLMARKGYLERQDVIDLLGIALVKSWDVMQPHIEARRQAINDNTLFIEFETIAKKAAIDNPPPG